MGRSQVAKLRPLAESLGLKVSMQMTMEDLQVQIGAKLHALLAAKRIATNTTIEYAAGAPPNLVGKKLRVVSMELNWDTHHPRIALGQPDHFYSACTLLQFATAVK